MIPVHARISGKNLQPQAQARVDPEDEALALGRTWRFSGRGQVICSKGNQTFTLSRLILGYLEKGRIYHLDGDPLNNTRANLFFLEAGQKLPRFIAQDDRSFWVRVDRTRYLGPYPGQLEASEALERFRRSPFSTQTAA